MTWDKPGADPVGDVARAAAQMRDEYGGKGGVRWADTGEPIRTEQQLIDHPNRVVEVYDYRGTVTDRYRPRNLGGPMLKPLRS